MLWVAILKIFITIIILEELLINSNITISLTGALGMISTNGTWFTIAFSKNYFKEDKSRTVLAGGLGNVNFQY